MRIGLYRRADHSMFANRTLDVPVIWPLAILPENLAGVGWQFVSGGVASWYCPEKVPSARMVATIETVTAQRPARDSIVIVVPFTRACRGRHHLLSLRQTCPE